jgi:predicted NUDIX family NTP pyrophosphohydrolase
MPKQSAGLLLYRRAAHGLEVLLVHPGGPFWARKDLGAWSIPKGEFDSSESALDAARREVREETGLEADGSFTPLTPVRQRGGKTVHAFALETDWDPAGLRSNSFSMEYPPRSGLTREFPEVDRAEWFDLAEGRRKILPSQEPLLIELETLLNR